MFSEQDDFVAMGQKAQTPSMDPSIHDVSTEEVIEAKLGEIRAIPNDADRIYQLGILKGHMETMKRNIEQGYTYWARDLHILEEVVRRAPKGIYGGLF